MAENALRCQWCGYGPDGTTESEFGNQGALANHENNCPANAQERDVPAAREQPEQTQPVTAAEQSTGGTLADAMIAVVDDDAPMEARQNAIRGGLGIAGDLITRYQTYRQKKLQQQKKRAANVELNEVVEFPECECGYQFDGEDIGISNDQVRCPMCTKLYRINDAPENPS